MEENFEKTIETIVDIFVNKGIPPYLIVLFLIAFLVAIVVVYVKVANLKKNVKGEQEEMNYRKANYRQIEKQEDGQKIDSVVNAYKLDEKKGIVYEDVNDKVDLQKLIESYAETALQKVIAKFLPQTDDDPIIEDISSTSEDLDFLTETMSELDDIKLSYGLPLNATIGEMEQALRTRLENYNKKENKEDEKKTQNE